jgi:hypothetical protein
MSNTLSFRSTILGILAISLSPAIAQAKTCTEADIRAAASSGKSFSYSGSGCTNKSGIITFKKGISVSKSGWKFDGSGIARLVWKGGGGCDKTPRGGEYAFFDLKGSKNTLANFSAEGAPEGIHVSTGSGNVIDGVSFPFICEDAITNGNKKSSSASGTVVRRSKFRGSNDKAIQVNGGSITVEDSDFANVYRSIASCSVKADPGHHEAKPCGFRSKIIARRNKIKGCNGYAMRAAGKDSAKGGTLLAENNYVTDCSTPVQVEEEGFAEVRNNEFYGNCDTGVKVLTSKGKALYGCGNRNSCRKLFSGKVTEEKNCK